MLEDTFMELQNAKTNWLAIAGSLGEIRDSLTTLSLVLNDHIADIPSSKRDEVMAQVECLLARARIVGHGQ
jgi:Fic family protein